MNKIKIALILSCILGITGLMQYTCFASTEGWSKNNGAWYFYNSEGYMKTGWLNDNGTWYYLNTDGSMRTGWLNHNGSWYYLKDDGSMADGWVKVDEKWYYLNDDGSMKIGWIKDEGFWYYLNDDGSMAHDITVDSYMLDSNGRWIEYVNDAAKKEDENSFIDNIKSFSEKASVSVLNKDNRTKNKLFSPISLFGALSVLSEGAANSTKDDIFKGLCLSDNTNFSEEYKKFIQQETIDSEYTKLKLSNSVWLDNRNKSIKFKDDTMNNISKEYNADIFKENLTSDSCAKKISNWISKNTYGVVGTDYNEFKLDPSSDIKMEIFNTIYFKSKWSDPFYIENTKKDKFTLSDKSIVDTDFMNKSDINYLYEKRDEYQISSLGFKDGYEMAFVLPAEGKSPYDILNNTNKLNEVLTNAEEIENSKLYNINYKIPKFKYKCNMDLNDSMQKIGFKSIYDLDADFSNFTESTNLYVSNVKQDSGITVDENGAEAAAFTEINLIEGAICIDSEEERDFILNRPFLFIIMDRSKLPIFIGIVNNPIEK